MIQMPEIVTSEELAAYLKVSKKTIQNMVSREELLEGIYIGRDRYNMTKLKQYLEDPPYRYAISVRSKDYCKELKL